MNDIQEKETKKIVNRFINNPLTKKEIEEYEEGGWKLLSCEPQITFTVTNPEIMSGTLLRYMFSKTYNL